MDSQLNAPEVYNNNAIWRFLSLLTGCSNHGLVLRNFIDDNFFAVPNRRVILIKINNECNSYSFSFSLSPL